MLRRVQEKLFNKLLPDSLRMKGIQFFVKREGLKGQMERLTTKFPSRFHYGVENGKAEVVVVECPLGPPNLPYSLEKALAHVLVILDPVTEEECKVTLAVQGMPDDYERRHGFSHMWDPIFQVKNTFSGRYFKEEGSPPRPDFPLDLCCPGCTKKFHAPEPGLFKCPNCGLPLMVDEFGSAHDLKKMRS